MVETWEERQAREKRERKKRQEQEELLMMAYAAGNIGSVYRMEAAVMAAEG